MNIIILKRQASASMAFTPFVFLSISTENCSGKQTDGLGRVSVVCSTIVWSLFKLYAKNYIVSVDNL